MREATREEVVEKIGESTTKAPEVEWLVPQPQAGKMREESAPAGQVRVVGGIASAIGGAVKITE
jgi:hypothetical protein